MTTPLWDPGQALPWRLAREKKKLQRNLPQDNVSRALLWDPEEALAWELARENEQVSLKLPQDRAATDPVQDYIKAMETQQMAKQQL